MYKSILFFSLLLFFTGCSKTTAFSHFDMNDENERAITNLKSATIVNNGKTEAIISAIYLNNVSESAVTEEHEAFVVAIYQNAQGIRLSKTRLNGALPADVRELEKGDRLRSFMPISNDWNSYFLLSYPLQEGETLELIFENDPSGKALLTYQKELR